MILYYTVRGPVSYIAYRGNLGSETGTSEETGAASCGQIDKYVS